MKWYKNSNSGHIIKQIPHVLPKLDIIDDWDADVTTVPAQPHPRIPASYVTLMEAQQGVKAALFNRLLVDGVSFDEKHFYNQNALFLAAEHDSPQALELLASAGANLNTEDMFGETALFSAVSHSAVTAARWLLEHDVDVAHKTPEGETALHVAAMTSVTCLELLLQHGADVNAPKTKGTTPLMMAAVNHSECVAALLKHGADVNVKSIFGDTAMLYAVRSGNVEAVRCLVKKVDDIEYGCPGYPSPACPRTYTPLGMAVWALNPEMVDVLLEAGADANGFYADHADFKILHLAVAYIGKAPLERSHSIISLTTEKKLRLQIVRSLVNYGAQVDSRDECQHTPLMVACWNGDSNLMEFLISKHADLNSVNCNGFTPLYFSSRRGDVSAVRLLMQHGAIAQFELHDAVVQNLEDIVHAMVDSGATPHLADPKPNSKNPNPMSPLHLALRHSRMRLAEFFLSRSFVTQWDLYEVSKDLKLMQQLNELRFSKEGIPESLYQLFDFQYFQTPTPPSLFLCSFVSVSERLGAGSARPQRVRQTGLCQPLQDKLLFQEGRSRSSTEGGSDSEEVNADSGVTKFVKEESGSKIEDFGSSTTSDQLCQSRTASKDYGKNSDASFSDLELSSAEHQQLLSKENCQSIEGLDEHTIVLVNENTSVLDFDVHNADSHVIDST